MTRSQISPEYLLFIVVPSSRNLLNYLTQSFISLRRSFYPGLKFKAILKLAPPMCPTCQGLTSGNTQYNLTERFLSIFIIVGDSC